MGLIQALACDPEDLQLLKRVVVALEDTNRKIAWDDRRDLAQAIRLFNERLVPIAYNPEDLICPGFPESPTNGD